MKTTRTLLVSALLLPAALFAQSRNTPTPEPAYPPPTSTTVNVRTTASELAEGYAAAIPQMTLKSVVIFAKSDGKVVPIKGVRSVRALSGVLLIEFSAGDRMAINAEQIVMITDGTRTP